MRLLPPLLALTLASAASAQSWEFTFSNDTLSPENPSTTVTLWATFAPGDAAFNGAGLDLLASEPMWHPASLTALLEHPGQDPGEALPDGRTIEGILVGQVAGSFSPDPANPLAVWEATFSVSDFTPRQVIFATDTEGFSVYTELGGRYPPYEPRDPIDVEVPLQVIPAPGAAVLAALGLGTLAIRRHRSDAVC